MNTRRLQVQSDEYEEVRNVNEEEKQDDTDGSESETDNMLPPE